MKLSKKQKAEIEEARVQKERMLSFLATDRERKLFLALEAAHQHLEFCGYGDSYERECAKEQGLDKQIGAALDSCWELLVAGKSPPPSIAGELLDALRRLYFMTRDGPILQRDCDHAELPKMIEKAHAAGVRGVYSPKEET